MFSEGRGIMRSWRSRLLGTLIVYAAGFATAVYALAPAESAGATQKPGTKATAQADAWKARSEQYAKAAGVGLRQFVSFAEEKAVQASEALQKKLAEKQRGSGK
jgi:hypothetical protein